jgi:hypothetical protein
MKQKVLSILALLLIAVTGVMAQANLTYVDLTTDMFHTWSSVEPDAEITEIKPYRINDIGVDVSPGGTIYGDGNIVAKGYANLSEYKVMTIDFTGEGFPRVIFNRSTD